MVENLLERTARLGLGHVPTRELLNTAEKHNETTSSSMDTAMTILPRVGEKAASRTAAAEGTNDNSARRLA